MSESDIDRLLYEMLEGDTDRAHGEAIIAMAKHAKERQGNAEDPLVQVLNQAHRMKAEDDQQ